MGKLKTSKGAAKTAPKEDPKEAPKKRGRPPKEKD